MKKLLLATSFATLAFCLLIVSGCKKESAKPAVIYLTMAHTADLIYYNDDNSTIPVGFESGKAYGPCDAGTYTFQYKLGISPNTLKSGTYTLVMPAPGQKRSYTFQILNSIVAGVPNISFRYTDASY